MSPRIVTSEELIERTECDVAVLGAYQQEQGVALSPDGDRLDRTLDGYLSERARASAFKARIGDVLIIPTFRRIGPAAVALAGLGAQAEATSTVLRRAAGAAARRCSDHKIVASTLHRGGAERGAEAVAEGFLLGSYSFTRYKSDPRPSKIERVVFVGHADPGELERARVASEATRLARDLTNEPPGVLTPEEFAQRACEVAEHSGMFCKIFDERALSERGFGGILTVASGSDKPPRLIELRHSPEQATSKLAIVGKGITFDSGGLSLKDARGMETMKTDMAGGAAVLGAIHAVSTLELPVEVIALIAATENMPGGSAYKPGDVIRHYGGHTSEVLNTDAEGRLVLADALAYGCELDPGAIVDVATLTGGIVVALGKKAAGVFSNDETLRDEVLAAADLAGERMWTMPLFDDYRTEIDSEVADIKNSGGRYGSPILGALFLRDFLKAGIPWAHIDVAGPARADSDYDEVVRGGTGVATRTLIAWIEERAR